MLLRLACTCVLHGDGVSECGDVAEFAKERRRHEAMLRARCRRSEEEISESTWPLLSRRQPNPIGRQTLRQDLRGDLAPDLEPRLGVDRVVDAPGNVRHPHFV